MPYMRALIYSTSISVALFLHIDYRTDLLTLIPAHFILHTLALAVHFSLKILNMLKNWAAVESEVRKSDLVNCKADELKLIGNTVQVLVKESSANRTYTGNVNSVE